NTQIKNHHAVERAVDRDKCHRHGDMDETELQTFEEHDFSRHCGRHNDDNSTGIRNGRWGTPCRCNFRQISAKHNGDLRRIPLKKSKHFYIENRSTRPWKAASSSGDGSRPPKLRTTLKAATPDRSK